MTAAAAAGHHDAVPRLFLALTDVAVLAGAFLAANLVAPLVQWLLLPSGPLRLPLPASLGLPEGPVEFPPLTSELWVLAVSTPATLVFTEILGGYRPLADRSLTSIVGRAALAPMLSLSLATLALFALKDSSSSRVLVFTFGVASVVGLAGYRAALRVYKRRRLASGAYAKNVLVVARPAAAARVASHFARHVHANRFHLAGWLELDGFSAPADDPGRRRPPRLGAVDDLAGLLVNQPIHEVVAVQSPSDEAWLGRVIDECDYFRVRLRIVPEALLGSPVRDPALVFRHDPLRLPEIVLEPPHLDSDVLFVKRLVDIVGSAALLALLSPVFLLVAVAIKLTTPDLPVFYPWRVIGLKGRPFTGYKFTTMVAGAEEMRDELLPRNEMQGPVFKVRDDPRVTRLGRFLRKYSINELPQLWSVLTGDMSLVGPRPAFRHELERYELWHKRKLCVKPGITCLWQVSGRNRINDFDDWVRLDLEYIDRWSLWLDFRILCRTAWAVLAGTGS